jgi:hypothetical protein
MHSAPEQHMIKTCAFDMAQRFIGLQEIAGEMHNPAIMAMLTMDM